MKSRWPLLVGCVGAICLIALSFKVFLWVLRS